MNYTTTTCPECATSAREPWHHFTGGCKGCAARSIARSPHFHRVSQAGMQDRAYRMALQQFAVSHEEVKAAAASDALKTERAAA
jgi:hypothetical protein